MIDKKYNLLKAKAGTGAAILALQAVLKLMEVAWQTKLDSENKVDAGALLLRAGSMVSDAKRWLDSSETEK